MVESCICVMSYVIIIFKSIYITVQLINVICHRETMPWRGKDDITYQERLGGGGGVAANVTSFVSFKRINLICFPLCHLFQTLLFPTSCRTLQAHEELFSWMETTWDVGNNDPLARNIKEQQDTVTVRHKICSLCYLYI